MKASDIELTVKYGEKIGRIDPETFRPVNGKMLVKMPKVEEKTAGGIIMANAAQKEELSCEKGILLTCAPDSFRDWLDKPTPGDHIYFLAYMGRNMYDKEGNLYKILGQKDINGFEKIDYNNHNKE